MNKHFTGILNPHDSYFNGYEVWDFELSKDGTQARYDMKQRYTTLERGYVLMDIKSFEEDFRHYFGESKGGYWGVCHDEKRYMVLTEIYAADDSFDDIVHISSYSTYQQSFTVDMEGSKAGIKDGTEIIIHLKRCLTVTLFTSAESAMRYLEEKFSEDGFKVEKKDSLQEKFSEWLRNYGNDNNAIKAWQDYNGGYEQLEWAIDNGLGTIDYDEWQAAQRIMKHDLKWETASEIIKALYEKEDLDIFDCE